MKSTVKKILLATFAAMMLAATASTAHAADRGQANYPPAWNTKEQYLTATPRDWMENGRVERSVFLEKGTYIWAMVWPPVYECTARTLDLPRGWYSWRGLLDPKHNYYRESAVLEGPVTVHIGCDQTFSHDATYEWGTRLNLVRVG